MSGFADRVADRAGEQDLGDFAVKTYRYLRLSIVIVVAALLASVALEARAVEWSWLESISAYYYTPAHSVFVGGLVAIGVALIAVRGSGDIEDMLLNVAGVLAPIVAFVPTTALTDADVTSARVVLEGNPEAFIDNNVWAMAIGGAIAVAVVLALAIRSRKAKVGAPDVNTWIGISLSGALLIAGVIWYAAARESFLERAHGGVMLINALNARPRYRLTYAILFSVMVLSGLGTLVLKLTVDPNHLVLWVELLELTPFAIFWAVQTVELWKGGVRGAEPVTAAVAAPRP
jgi:hypothetical protein